MKRIEYTFMQPLGPYNIPYLREAERGKDKERRRRGWFQCPICGKEFSSVIKNVKDGNVKSCGCLAIQTKSLNGKKNAKNLTGQKFGNLTALEPTNERNRNQVVWKCQCDCGNIHYAPSAELIRGKVRSCGCVYSFGEQQIRQILQKLQIETKTQFQFEDCRNPKTNAKLYFDFYLPKYNCCIEYDGRQHFKEYSGSWEKLEDVQYRDSIKNKYCKEHNIPLIRIPYTDKSKLNEEYLKNKLEKICPVI